MDNKVEEFLAHHKVGVISILSPQNIPHASTVHYAHSDNPFHVYIITEKKSKKCVGLLDGLSTNASFVTGFSEEEWVTFQADGDIHIPRSEKELDEAKAAYYLKFPNALANEHNQNLTFLIFTPTSWKYTNLNPEPWEIISSEK
ncbi:MAG TPA: pyridoxamine 5'-phosphate oxidase family protein [Patescibacteria group bacterium]